MKQRSRVVAAGVTLALTVGCASTPKVPVVGRAVTVVPHGEGPRVKGELLAVGPEQFWVKDEDEVRGVAWPAVREVQVRRHGFGRGKAFEWALIGGLLTGGALTAACSSADAENCGGVGLVTVGAWMLIGLLAAPSMESSSRLDVLRPTADDLRPFARFPQGWPEALRPPSLGPGTDDGPSDPD